MTGRRLWALAFATILGMPSATAVRAQVRAPEAPRPVLLVPGWSEGGRSLETLRDRLLEAGWRENGVAVVDFRDPVGSNAITRSPGSEIPNDSTSPDRIPSFIV